MSDGPAWGSRGVIKNIQGLRALAALLIVAVHLEKLLANIGMVTFGGAGVDLFFVISGFVMVHTTRSAPPSPTEFMRNRISRIVPIYWLVTCAVFTLAWIAPQLMRSTVADPVQLAKSLLFIPFTKPSGLIQPVLFLGWTLNYEMFFYALFALGLTLRNYLAGVSAVAAVMIALVLFGVVFQPTSAIGQFYTGDIVLDFVLGMGVGLWGTRVPQATGSAAKLATLGCTTAAFIFAVAAPVVWSNVPSVLTSGLAATMVVTGAIWLEHWGWRIASPLVLALGDASYVTYLIHPLVTEAAQKVGVKLQADAPLSALLILAAFVTVAAAGLVLHRVLERPLFAATLKLLAVQRLNPRPA